MKICAGILLAASLLAAGPVPAPARQLVGPDRIYLRLTNLRRDDVKVLVRVHIVPNRNRPFGGADTVRTASPAPTTLACKRTCQPDPAR